ncbi:uncharacterized protein MYCFIDRAFT_177596 [Pseudocercospora fijiensis CIRAD86]|uniref:Uncharacterized protein n=1 Tax=Pseudocercospora fijiensis (strain CIRAD86) TaxID=383855 RepID=M2YSH2_PSEFD|nr:uncharacterized protein MYCFIDRAFT_177596 [Pseudocercospora fijiensis CIRAD86]EME80665.1 hypothetical protein MYCFIDRAFT_177596 [Pseudocercospora fijiensis CIRAD86]
MLRNDSKIFPRSMPIRDQGRGFLMGSCVYNSWGALRLSPPMPKAVDIIRATRRTKARTNREPSIYQPIVLLCVDNEFVPDGSLLTWYHISLLNQSESLLFCINHEPQQLLTLTDLQARFILSSQSCPFLVHSTPKLTNLQARFKRSSQDFPVCVQSPPKLTTNHRESEFLGRQLRRDQIEAMMNAESIAEERRLMFQYIRDWSPNVPKWQGEEPLPLGSDPNEKAVRALARQRQEYADQDYDVRMTPGEIIEMHEPTPAEPDLGEDVWRPGERNPGSIDDESDGEEDHGGRFYHRDDEEFNRELFFHPEDLIGSNFDSDSTSSSDSNSTISPDPDSLTNDADEAWLDQQWDHIQRFEAAVETWKSHRTAALTSFRTAYREWSHTASSAASQAFTSHYRNATKVTSSNACRTSILTWFPDLPSDVKSALARIARCENKLEALAFDIESLRYEAAMDHESAEARWMQFRKSETYRLGEQLTEGKGRFGYESKAAFSSGCACLDCIPLSARFEGKAEDLVGIEAGLAIREVRLQMAERECRAETATWDGIDSERFAIVLAGLWAQNAGTALDAEIRRVSSQPEGEFLRELVGGMRELAQKLVGFQRRSRLRALRNEWVNPFLSFLIPRVVTRPSETSEAATSPQFPTALEKPNS